jgi:magnesium-transporting ATPase (P-type)
LPEPPRRGLLARFLAHFHDPLIYVLLGAATVTALLEHLVDTAVILAVVVANTLIGMVQEGKAERALRAIRNMLAPEATVLRDGQRCKVSGERLVPGDVVILEPGDRVPADLRLLSTRGLRIDEAILTGESVTAEKTETPVEDAAPLGDRTSMGYSGTLVAAGQGRGVVVATGAQTELGQISRMLAEVESVDTPLLRQMTVFSRWLTAFVLAAAALLLAFGSLVGHLPFSELFMAVVGLSVAAIPEGLPAILSVTLAIGVQGMAARKAIVRRMPAIETLGAVSVICSDKTGTLTRNEMMVASVATSARLFEVTGEGYAPKGAFLLDGAEVEPADHPLLTELTAASVLCNEATLRPTTSGFSIEGDPMEGALVTLAMKGGLDVEGLRRSTPEVDSIPFDAAHRFMACLRHDHAGHATLYLKGAPEQLLALCVAERGERGEETTLDAPRWRARVEQIAASGQRVLAIAERPMPGTQRALRFEDVEEGLVLLGLVGLLDPPREEAISAVADCRAAGIQVKMITGDHAATALAIGARLGLANVSTALEGRELDALDPRQLAERVRDVDVFARTSPEHKLRLVEALQSEGAVVAMTGDGVNDAPALKRADVGIAMGGKGTEAAKEASEMVLADDNFATIAEAIRAGRTVYDNLRKAVVFLLPVNGGEALSLVTALLFGLTLPISPLQILWVNMVSSVVLAMSLAFEPPEPGVMRRRPRQPDEAMLSGFVLWRVAFVSVLFSAGIFGKFALAEAQGAGHAEARTIAVNTLVVMEIFYLFSVRFLHDPSLTLRGVLGTKPVLAAVSAVTVLQLTFTYAPFMETFFDTRPLTLYQGVQVIAVGIVIMLVLEAEKRLTRRWLRSSEEGLT